MKKFSLPKLKKPSFRKKEDKKIDWKVLKPEFIDDKSEWLKNEPKLPPSTDATQFEKPTFKPSTFKPLKVWHVGGIRTAKRVLAAILFFFDVIFFLGTIGSQMIWFELFFFATSFILLDYLWKSKKVKIEFDF